MSKHLRVLREVGVVDVRKDGRQRLYRLNGHALKPIHDWVQGYEETWSERFDQLDVVLQELKGEGGGDGGVAGSGTATVTLPTEDQILITREFDAPRAGLEGVDHAGAREAVVARRGEVTLAEIDLRTSAAPGGTSR